MIVLDIDPNVVKPGWTPLIITILLAAAIALLMISMRRQIRKVKVPYRDELGTPNPAEADEVAPDESDADDSAKDPAEEERRHPIGNSG